MCNTTQQKDKEKSEMLINILQENQQTWFAQWATEMIRIAKPGKPIIFEQVSSVANCDNGMGGVPPKFWKQSIHNYQWDVDLSSVKFWKLQREERYHVFMKKSGATV